MITGIIFEGLQCSQTWYSRGTVLLPMVEIFQDNHLKGLFTLPKTIWDSKSFLYKTVPCELVAEG